MTVFHPLLQQVSEFTCNLSFFLFSTGSPHFTKIIPCLSDALWFYSFLRCNTSQIFRLCRFICKWDSRGVNTYPALIRSLQVQINLIRIEQDWQHRPDRKRGCENVIPLSRHKIHMVINCVPAKKIGNATNRLREVSADDKTQSLVPGLNALLLH